MFAAHEDDVHADMDFTVPMDEFELDQRFIADAHAGDKVAIGDTGITITLPDEYANGDTVRVRAPASSEFMDYHRQMAAASPAVTANAPTVSRMHARSDGDTCHTTQYGVQ